MHILQILLVGLFVSIENVNGFAASAYKIRTKDKEKCVKAFTNHAFQQKLFKDGTRDQEEVSVAVYFIPERGAGFVCGYKSGEPCFPSDSDSEAEINHFKQRLNQTTKFDITNHGTLEALIRRTRHEFCASGICTFEMTNSTNSTSGICGDKCIRGLSCKEVGEHGITTVYENGDEPHTDSVIMNVPGFWTVRLFFIFDIIYFILF